MSEQQQAAKSAKIEEYVLYALRKADIKVGDLTEEQRARAVEAPSESGGKAGLRGDALVAWITDGLNGKQQVAEARKARELARSQQATENRSAAQKAAGNKPPKPKAPSKYSDEVRAAVKIANEIRDAKGHGAGPKQHQHVRDVITKEMGGAPKDAGALLAFVGVKKGDLVAIANGKADREAMKVLLPTAEKMGDDPWCKGRHLAAELAAWAQQLEG